MSRDQSTIVTVAAAVPRAIQWAFVALLYSRSLVLNEARPIPVLLGMLVQSAAAGMHQAQTAVSKLMETARPRMLA
jgi:hypothetical protein